MEQTPSANKAKTSQKVLTVVGAILCVLFGLMLICNIVIIAKGNIDPERPPSVLGVTPLVVLSGSMSGDAPDHIEAGDLIFVVEAEPSQLKVGDIITYMEGTTAVTHRIIDITTQDGKLLFYTKGDANNTADEVPVSQEDLVGIYTGRIPMVGDLAIFMQTPLGMIIFIGLPLIAFLAYDMIRRQKHAAKDQEKTAQLEAELERLRALAAEKENTQE